MTTQVTQCPNCHTSFRVTEAQLNIANGAVRCGSCLHIFHAPDHWLDGSSNPQPGFGYSETTETFTPEPDTAAGEPPTTDDDHPLERDDESATTDPALTATGFTKPAALKSLDDEPEPAMNATIEQNALDSIFDKDLFGSEKLDLLESHLPEDDASEFDQLERHSAISDSIERSSAEDDEDDLLISDDMDGDEDDDAKSINDTSQFPAIESIDHEHPLESEFDEENGEEKTGDYTDVFLDIEDWEEHDDRVFKDLDELGEETSVSGEDWADKLLEDENDTGLESARNTAASDTNNAKQDVLKSDEHSDLFSEDDSSEEPDDQFQDIFENIEEQGSIKLDPELMDILNQRDHANDEETLVEDEFELGNEPLMAGERIGADKLALLANIEPEPVVFARAIDSGRWARRGWTVGLVLALLLFAGQYIVFNFDWLARDDSYRGSLSSLCALVGCTIPDRDDIRMIHSTNLMVRSHPNVADALVVDAIITNRADFKQHFPDMELQFTDLDGRIIAGRRFAPMEYLEGELAGLRVMPVKQPIHIALEIIDPGKDAVNYQLRLFPQQGS